jgi:hypothetical protein
MARRNNRIAIPAGPTWTDAYKTSQAGGSDGAVGAAEILISCAADSENAIQYRLEIPADPAGESATLFPGESVRLTGHTQPIRHVVMRGVGGSAVGGVEVLSV